MPTRRAARSFRPTLDTLPGRIAPCVFFPDPSDTQNYNGSPMDCADSSSPPPADTSSSDPSSSPYVDPSSSSPYGY